MPGPPLPKAAESVPQGAFAPTAFAGLRPDPRRTVGGVFKGIPYTARVAIPDYDRRIARRYQAVAPLGLAAVSQRSEIPFGLPRFGLVVAFEQPAEIAVHDAAMRLEDSIRALVGEYGPVLFRNAFIAGPERESFHRNIFPHLRFHVDRGPAVPNQYSCFTRDPFDADQREPRASSTMFMANIVAWLKMVGNGGGGGGAERGVRASYDLFHDAELTEVLGDVVLDQPWDAPAGSGEIAVVDNRTVLHATCHKDGETKGYPIGARYLA